MSVDKTDKTAERLRAMRQPATPASPRGSRWAHESMPAEAPVTKYFLGEFEYYRPGSRRQSKPPVITVGKSCVSFTVALVREVEQALGAMPKRLKVGIDPKRCLIEIRPDPNGLIVKLTKSRYAIVSRAMALWLREQGVSGVIEAHWQPQTQSVVGKYKPAEAEAATEDDAQAEASR